MRYLDFLIIAKKYSCTFEYGFSRKAFKSKLFWFSLLAFCGMALGLLNTFKILQIIPERIAFWSVMIFEVAFIFLYFGNAENLKRNKQISLGAFDPIADKDKRPIDIRSRWLENNLPFPKEKYIELIETFEKIDTRLTTRLQKNSHFEMLVKSLLSWTYKTKSIATIILTSLAIFTTQALLENKPWAKPILSNMTASNIQAAAILSAGALIFIILIIFLFRIARSATNYWTDEMTRHGCSDESVNRLISDMLQLASVGTPQPKPDNPPILDL